MISIQHISQSYKEIPAVNDISIEVKEGEPLGLSVLTGPAKPP